VYTLATAGQAEKRLFQAACVQLIGMAQQGQLNSQVGVPGLLAAAQTPGQPGGWVSRLRGGMRFERPHHDGAQPQWLQAWHPWDWAPWACRLVHLRRTA
jgi:hypothetical protein